MTLTPPAPVAPSLLVWAREDIGLTIDEAAKKVAVSPGRLTSWEAGESVPSVAQLRRLASAYKRPLAVFFLPEPPRGFRPLHDFRRLHGAEEDQWSPGLRLAVRRALQQQEAARELRDLLGEAGPPGPTVSASPDDSERYATEARDLLGVSLDRQFAWRDRYKALAGWIGALEESGVLVLQTSGLGLDEMRGFSLSDSLVPVVVLNGSDAPRGRVFTALHEWTHLLLNDPGVCDLHDAQEAPDREDEVEQFCNEVAAAILMPREAFQSESAVKAAQAAGVTSDAAVGELANRYSVSQEAVVRRLVTLGAVPWDFYMRKREQYQAAYAKRRQEGEGFAPYHRVKVRDLGKAYVRLVLDAYHEDRINVSDVSDYLGVRLKHLPQIEREALSAGIA